MGEAEAQAGRQAEYARAQEARSTQMEAALEQTRQACFERDRRLAWLEAELDLSRSTAASQMRGIAALAVELDALKLAARGQATRIRLQALREAAAASVAARELGRAAGEGDAEAAAPLLEALERALQRLSGEWEDVTEPAEADFEPVPVARAADDAAAGTTAEAAWSPPAGPEPAAANGSSPNGAAPVDGRRVNVDIGPFSDFSQLVSFEDAANAIGATGEISIRRFSEGRANIDVDLDEPIDLLRELEERCDLEFKVRAKGDDEIILDLGE